MNLYYGMQGDDVRKLQEGLNQQGYGLTVDGIFGQQTQQAVRDYQSKNGLSVDGIAGPNTLGMLYGNSANTDASTTQQPAGGTDSDAAASTTTPDYSQYAYDSSTDEAYQAAWGVLQQAQSAMPTYQSSYDDQIRDAYQNIVDRDDFSYDVNSDALYQQYRDQYVLQGQLAMMDTMGQAAAMTGGYGNSYAATVGNQAYQSYLQQLNEVVPELYQLALDRYNQEGQELYNQYSLLRDMEDSEYSRYQDSMDRYWQNVYYQKEIADDAYNRGSENFYNSYQLGYQAERDKVADEQWDREFNEAVRQYNTSNGLSSTGGGGTGGGSGGSGGGGGNGGGAYDANTAAVQQQLKDAGYDIVVDGIWGPKTQAAYDDYNSGGGGNDNDTGGGGGSYYDQLLGSVATAAGLYSQQSYSDRQKAYQEIVAAINDAFNNGQITAAQKQELLRMAMPGPR